LRSWRRAATTAPSRRRRCGEGLLLSPLSASCSGPSPLHGFVLGFGNTHEARMEAAVERFGKLVDAGSRRPIPRKAAQ